jgi:hypothetical protein
MGKTNGSYRVVFSIDVDSLHGGLSLVWLLAALHVSIETRSCVVSKAEKKILCPALSSWILLITLAGENREEKKITEREMRNFVRMGWDSDTSHVVGIT